MWELDHIENWEPKNWCFQTVVLEKTLESHLDCREIKPVSPKRNQPWLFIGRTHAETEAPVLWPPDLKSWLFGKDSDAGKDWGQEEKGAVTEDEMLGWPHWLNGYEFGQTQGDNNGHRSLEHATVYGVTRSQTWLSDWTATTAYIMHMCMLLLLLSHFSCVQLCATP